MPFVHLRCLLLWPDLPQPRTGWRCRLSPPHKAASAGEQVVQAALKRFLEAREKPSGSLRTGSRAVYQLESLAGAT